MVSRSRHRRLPGWARPDRIDIGIGTRLRPATRFERPFKENMLSVDSQLASQLDDCLTETESHVPREPRIVQRMCWIFG